MPHFVEGPGCLDGCVVLSCIACLAALDARFILSIDALFPTQDFDRRSYAA
jgi:hypothetical protein